MGVRYGIIRDDETGRKFEVQYTDELMRDYSAACEKNQCSHPHLETRRFTNRNNSIAYCMQCQTCGERIGNAIGKNSIPDIAQVPDMDPEISARWRKARAERIHVVEQKHLRIQCAQKLEWWKRYNEYLESPAWKIRRDLVMQRAGGICEGCRMASAEQVHHLTYEHVTNEFLWELVAICKPCHSRIHEDEEGPPDEEEADSFEEPSIPEPEEQSVRFETKEEIQAEFDRIMAEFDSHSINDHTKRDQS